jgi:hypothetical protein
MMTTKNAARAPRLALLAASLALASAAACSSGSVPAADRDRPAAPAAAPAPPLAAGFVGDNGAILAGAPIEGTGGADRRELPVIVGPGVADLAIGTALVTRSGPHSPRSRLIVEITNRGTATYCDVRLVELQYLGAGRRRLQPATEATVLGSIRQTETSAAERCLVPGERTYAVDLAPVDVGQVTALALRVAATAAETAAPAARVHAVRYDVADNDVAITIENTGPGAARLTGVQIVYLDAGGLPLGWTRPPVPATEVAAGASVVVADNTTRFLGASRDLYVRVDYRLP